MNIGKLKTQKNHKLLIKAISKSKNIKKIRLLIIGSGELKTELSKMVSLMNLKKYFVIGQ